MVDLLVDWLVRSVPYLFFRCVGGQLVAWVLGRLVGCWGGWVLGWLVGWLRVAESLIGRAVWVVGLVGWLVVGLFAVASNAVVIRILQLPAS